MAATDNRDASAAASHAANPYERWWRRAMWLGIVQDWALGIPAIIAPERTLKALRQRPTRDPVWTSFAALITVLLSFSYIPGAQDPRRYRTSAFLSVVSRPPGVVFFLLLRRGAYPLFGIIDGLLFCVQAPLLYLTMRRARANEAGEQARASVTQAPVVRA